MNALHSLTRAAAAGLLVLGAAISPPTLIAQQPPEAVPALSLEEALELAENNNPTLLQQQNDITVARSQVRSAYGSMLPSLSAGSGLSYTASGERRYGSVTIAEQPAIYGSTYSLGANLQLDGATLLQPSVERAQRTATERRVAGVAADLESQVTQQYLAVLQAGERVEQAEREVARTGEHVRLAQARLEVGAGTPLDVRRAEVQQGRAEVSLLQARNERATTMLMLGQTVGVPLDPEVELTSEFGVFDPEWSSAQLVDVALGNNPALLAARASVDAASTSVTAARSTYLPSLSLQAGLTGSVYEASNLNPLVQEQLMGMQQSYGQCLDQNQIRTAVGLSPVTCRDPSDPAVVAGIRDQMESQYGGFPFNYTGQPLSASLSISLPLFTGFDRQLQVDRAKASAADARYQVHAEELRLRQEVSAAVLNLETAYQTVLLQEQVRENAEEELRLAQERFRFGAASSVEVTDAQTTLAQAEVDQIEAVYDFHRTLSALEALVGEPLR